jgi:hypothetical protein
MSIKGIPEFGNPGVKPPRQPLKNIERALRSFALDQNPSHLTGLLVNIRTSLNLLKSVPQKQFRALLKNRAGTTALYDYFKKYTYIQFIAIGSEWPITSKGIDGNGAWGPRQAEGQVLGKNNQDQHAIYMTKAGEALLSGNYKMLHQSLCNILRGINEPLASPNLSRNKLEGALKDLLADKFLDNELEILYLSLALHDIGKILKDKVDPRNGNIIDGKIQHRESGPYLAEDMLQALGYDNKNIAVIKFLIRHHSDYWDLFCHKVYGKYNNNTTPESLETDLLEFFLSPQTVEKSKIKKMMAIISIADVHASGDRYLSDAFIDFVAGNI